MTTHQLSLVIVKYHSAAILSRLLHSIQQQSYQPSEIIIIDNTDVEHNNNIADDDMRLFPHVRIFSQKNNLDFAKGYNLGIAKAQNPFVLLLNQRIICTPDAIKHLMSAMIGNVRLGAVAPLLLRKISPRVIDSCGIENNIFFCFTNIGEGETDLPDDAHERLVALSGAAMLLRKEAVDDIVSHGGGRNHEFFDEQFIAYKEDIDIGFRLRQRGWNIAVVPQSIMLYHRNAQKKATILADAEGRHRRSFRANAYSLRNQWWMLLKNIPTITLLLRAPLILLMECGKILVIFITHPNTLRILPSFFSGLPRIIAKRRAIIQSRHR